MKQIVKWLFALAFLLVLIAMVIHIRKTRDDIDARVSGDELYGKALKEIDQDKNLPAGIYDGRKALVVLPKYIDVMVLLARAYLLANHPDSAKIYAQKALAVDTNNSDALLYMVNIETNKGNTGEAEAYIDRYVRVYPEDKEMLIKKYYLLLQGKQFNEANVLYAQLRVKFKNDDTITNINANYYNTLAANEKREGRLRTALAYYLQALQFNPVNLAVLQQLVNAYVQQGNYRKAIEYNQKLIAAEPSSPVYLMNNADFWLRLDEKDSASFYATSALAFNVADTRLKENVIDFYLSLAKNGSAKDKVKYAEIITEIKEQQKDALLFLVNGSIQLKDYYAALGYTNTALNYYPSDVVFINKKIGILYDAGDYGGASRFMDEILHFYKPALYKGAYGEVQEKYAQQLMQTGRYAEALPSILSGLQYDSTNQTLKEMLVNAYAVNNRPKDAIKTVNALLIAAPANPGYLFKKAGLMESIQQYDSAAVITYNLHTSYPDNPLYTSAYLDELSAFAATSLRNGRYDDAITGAGKILAVDTANYTGYLCLANGLYNKGNIGKTLETVDKALVVFPADSLFMVKKSGLLMQSGNSAGALAITRFLKTKYPADTALNKIYMDDLFAAGKGYQKQNDWDNSLLVFEKAFRENARDTFSIENLAAIYFVKKKYDSALYYADKGLAIDPKNEYLLLKKTSALDNLKQYAQASKTAEKLLQLTPSPLLSDYADYLKSKTYLNKIGINQVQTFFTNPSKARGITGIQYTRLLKKASVTAYVNYLNEPGGNAWQYGADLIYNHNSKTYSDLYAFFSGSSLFPKIRAGYSLNGSIGKTWSGEAGAIYLNLDSIKDYAVTAGVGKYVTDNLFYFRAFYTTDTKNWYQSYQLSARHYLNDKMDFLSAIATLGSTPDDQSLNYKFINFSTFVTKSIGMGYRKNFDYKTSFNLFANMSNIKLGPADVRNEYDIYITLLRSF